MSAKYWGWNILGDRKKLLKKKIKKMVTMMVGEDEYLEIEFTEDAWLKY